MGVDSADDLSSLSFREVLKEAGISTNYDNCSSLEVWPESHWPGFALRHTYYSLMG